MAFMTNAQVVKIRQKIEARLERQQAALDATKTELLHWQQLELPLEDKPKK